MCSDVCSVIHEDAARAATPPPGVSAKEDCKKTMLDFLKKRGVSVPPEPINDADTADMEGATDIANMDDVRSEGGDTIVSVTQDALAAKDKLGTALQRLSALACLPAFASESCADHVLYISNPMVVVSFSSLPYSITCEGHTYYITPL